MRRDRIMHRFSQVDVFAERLTEGNPVAVVHDADDLSDSHMAAFAAWTNLSETTFLLSPTTPDADYRLRIFTPDRELPFAGHPTLGSARAWLDAGGTARDPAQPVQECGAGMVRVRRDPDDAGRLAFAAPPLLRSGPVDDADLTALRRGLGLRAADVVDAAWVDNGPHWVALLLRDAAAVLAVEPDLAALTGYDVGVVGLHPAGSDALVEVRAFVPGGGIGEDPVTGSLNAGLGRWLIDTGRVPTAYTAAQGTRLGRRGRVRVEQIGDDLWVGGATVPGILGSVHL
ncbi:PhzF family phenazine biosynthesis protein [Actinomycetospora atypica]|uniref:PhzF family phenazine biosynthesis protein n=1 Tax=Actinomycetospora atypica TaxID=1290095 RepID=A0ABV9YSK2_9PSEU